MADSWIDQSKLAAALASQQVGADGRNILTGQALLGALNPIAAPQWMPATTTMQRDSGGDYVPVQVPGYFVSSNGTILNSPDGGKTFTDTYDNPTGNGNKDQAQVTYQIQGGQAVPISANNAYNPSGWVDWGRDLTKIAGTVLSAGAAGAALGGGAAAAGAGGEAAAGGAAAGTAGGTTMGFGNVAGAAASANGAGSAGALAGQMAGEASLGTGALGSGLGYAAPSGFSSLAGAGMTSAQLDAISAAATAAGGSLTPAQMIAAAATASGPSLSASAATAAAGGGAATTSGGLLGSAASTAASGGSAASQMIPGVDNSTLLKSGVGLLGAAAGAAGAGSGLNSATTTDTKTIDPRIAQYVYGANGTSGLLGNVNSLMNSQLATGGLNATQTQGLNAQLSALQDPAYTSSLNQMRSVGSGLLGGNVAGNPFTSGQPSAQSAAPAGQAAMPPGWTPMATQLNQQQQQRPQMTGLLNNVRPYGN